MCSFIYLRLHVEDIVVCIAHSEASVSFEYYSGFPSFVVLKGVTIELIIAFHLLQHAKQTIQKPLNTLLTPMHT
jgi:hypothetical protein